jgi:hypothetical protein
MFVGAACNIWKRRNGWIHDGNFIHPNVIARLTKNGVEEYMKANQQRSRQWGEDGGRDSIRLTAPENGWLKVNWDIALDKSNGRIGVGVIVRNHVREVIAA